MITQTAIKQKFSRILTEQRKARDLKQKEVAAQIGEKLPTYQAWEEGRTSPPLKKVKKICELYEFFDIYRLMHSRLQPSKFA